MHHFRRPFNFKITFSEIMLSWNIIIKTVIKFSGNQVDYLNKYINKSIITVFNIFLFKLLSEKFLN